MTALIGSEGGWTDAELEAAKAAGWTRNHLGRTNSASRDSRDRCYHADATPVWGPKMRVAY